MWNSVLAYLKMKINSLAFFSDGDFVLYITFKYMFGGFF